MFHGFHASLARFEMVNFSPFRAILRRAGERIRGQRVSGHLCLVLDLDSAIVVAAVSVLLFGVRECARLQRAYAR